MHVDDLAQKISELLSSPDGLQKIQAVAASMGMLSGNKPETPLAEPASAASPSVADLGLAGGDLETLSKLMPLVSNFKQDDQDTLLLKALSPYLEEERRHRLDDTIKILHVIKLLPLLKDKGGLF